MAQRHRTLVDSGIADWKVHFELIVLNQRLRNPPAMYYHLKQILELYRYNRESCIEIAEALSKDEKWHEVIRYSKESLYYTGGDEEKIGETNS